MMIIGRGAQRKEEDIQRIRYYYMIDKDTKYYDILIDYEIATPEELGLVKDIVGGTWQEIFNKVIYSRTGYSDLEQWYDCELKQYYGEDEEIEDLLQETYYRSPLRYRKLRESKLKKRN